VFPKNAKIPQQISSYATSGRHDYVMITDRRTLTAKIVLYGMSSFHFYH